MSAHTPGPWELHGWEPIAKDSRGSYWGVVGYDAVRGFGPETARANAVLSAAAPDLLEALQYVLSAHGEQLTDAFEQAHKAIAKATGAA